MPIHQGTPDIPTLGREPRQAPLWVTKGCSLGQLTQQGWGPLWWSNNYRPPQSWLGLKAHNGGVRPPVSCISAKAEMHTLGQRGKGSRTDSSGLKSQLQSQRTLGYIKKELNSRLRALRGSGEPQKGQEHLSKVPVLYFNKAPLCWSLHGQGTAPGWGDNQLFLCPASPTTQVGPLKVRRDLIFYIPTTICCFKNSWGS